MFIIQWCIYCAILVETTLDYTIITCIDSESAYVHNHTLVHSVVNMFTKVATAEYLCHIQF